MRSKFGAKSNALLKPSLNAKYLLLSLCSILLSKPIPVKHTYIYSKLAEGSKFSSCTRGINKKHPPNVSDFRKIFSSFAKKNYVRRNISDFKLSPPVPQYQQIVFSDEASFDLWGFKLFHRPHIQNFWENTENTMILCGIRICWNL